MKPATLYIIQGFLGAGKTTFSQKLAADTEAYHLNPDEWCMRLFTKEEYETNWEKCFSATLDILWQKTKEYLNQGADVIFDMGFWDRASRDYARQIAQNCSAVYKHYYLYVPDEIAKERISRRSGKIAAENLKRFNEIKKFFIEPEEDENAIVINNY